MRFLLAALALSCGASLLRAQRSATVSVADPIYHAIDRLIAAGLVDTIIVGQRPYSRGEISRIVGEARMRASAIDDGNGGDAALRDALDDLIARFPPERGLASGRFQHAGRVDLMLTSTNGRPRPIPPDTGLGDIDAVVAPLAQSSGSRGGRDAMLGTTLAIETLQELAIGRHVTVVAHPRWRASTEPSFSGERALSIVSLAARLQASNVVMSVGRAPLVWGQARRSSLFLSENARALDMIWLGSERPWTMPGILRSLGPTSLSFFVADLGARQYFPHTTLIGYKGSIAPVRGLELGASALDFVGGRGAPRASFGDIVKNLFLRPFLPVEGYQFSNEMLGLEARLRVPGLAGFQAYWEMSLDDFDRSRLRSSFWTDDGAHVFGVSTPTVGGRVALAMELHHTGTRFNRHLQFRSGPTADRFLLGEMLGPDADGGYAFIDWDPRGGTTVGVELATEVYRADQYTIVQPPMRFHLIERRPRERRQRAMFSLQHRGIGRATELAVHAGIERVSRFAFVDGATRIHALGNVRLSVAIP